MGAARGILLACDRVRLCCVGVLTLFRHFCHRFQLLLLLVAVLGMLWCVVLCPRCRIDPLSAAAPRR